MRQLAHTAAAAAVAAHEYPSEPCSSAHSSLQCTAAQVPQAPRARAARWDSGAAHTARRGARPCSRLFRLTAFGAGGMLLWWLEPLISVVKVHAVCVPGARCVRVEPRLSCGCSMAACALSPGRARGGCGDAGDVDACGTDQQCM